jgi:hypothetical protein
MPVKLTRFQDVPQLTRSGSWECDFPLDYVWLQIENWQTEDGLDINPDFQRAHVWTEAQQIAWLEFFLRGGKTGRTLYFNHTAWGRTYKGWSVIVDGKQRLEAIRRLVHNEIPVFGSYLREFTDSLRLTQTIKINMNDLPTRAAVLQWYLEFNAGGTPHTNEEIDRVRVLLAAEVGK